MDIDDVKAGVKVYWPGDKGTPPDTGTIVEQSSLYADCEPSIWKTEGISAWVQWSNGEILWVRIDELKLASEAPTQITEQEAVMFLLNLGYTISKD